MGANTKKILIRILAILCVMAMLIPIALNAFAATFPYDVVSAEDVNIRQYPRSNSKLLGRIKAGEIVTLTSSNGNFYGVEYGGVKGYAMKMYIDGTTPTADLPLPDGVAPQILTGVSSFPYDTEIIYQVKMRKTPSDTGEVIRLLYAGMQVTVISYAGNGYAKVKISGTSGYINMNYMNQASIAEPTPTPTATPEPGADRYQTLQKGSEGSAVLTLQQALCELGYLTEDSPDGKFGAKTESAVKAFQKRNGLSQTGVVTPSMQVLLYEGTPKNNQGYRKKVSTVSSGTGDTIELGSKGNAVKVVQARLTTLGYYDGGLTGECDAETAAAILLFQGRNGYNADGILTAEQQDLLFSEDVVVNGPEPTPSPTPAPKYAKTLKLGSSGEEVVNLQRRLAELGYYTGSVSGSYDTATQEAVKAIQRKHSLTVDGIVGPVTHTVIYGQNALAAEENAPTATPAPTETPAPITAENVVILRAGASGDEVLRVQQRLQDLGYYTSRLDGNYLTDDIAAVKAFQKANGLTVDGTAGYQTQSLLFSEDAIACETTSVVSETSLRLGSKGSDVLKLQERLIKLGYLTGTADGIYDEETKEAVKAFQKANSLSQDGIAGAKTQELLYSDSAKACTSESLKLGMSGEAVKELQEKLISLGYLTGKADGIFGQKTSLALVAFQKNNGLTADGIAGKKTLALLESGKAKAATSTATTSATSTTEESTTVQTSTAPVITSISASQVKYAYWYSDMRAKCKLMPNVTVYDFTTGISWSLNMFSFGAHADCEPITAEDTAKMNKAFGGKTTWTPKVVWVMFSDGSVYIASTHNTPHGVQHNRTNNFAGHLCLHFPRTQAQVTSIGSYATSHQQAIDKAWASMQKSTTK